MGVSPTFPRASLKDDPTYLSGASGKDILGRSYGSPSLSHPMSNMTHWCFSYTQ